MRNQFELIAGKWKTKANIYHGKYRPTLGTGRPKPHPYKLEGVFKHMYKNSMYSYYIGRYKHFTRIDESHAVCKLCYTKVTYTKHTSGKYLYDKIFNEEDGKEHRVKIKGVYVCQVPESKPVTTKPKRRRIKVRHDPEPALTIEDGEIQCFK